MLWFPSAHKSYAYTIVYEACNNIKSKKIYTHLNFKILYG